MSALLGHLNYVKAARNTNPSVPQIEVIDGELIEAYPDQYMQLVGVSNLRQTTISMGNLRREETYDLDLVIRIWQGDTNDYGTVDSTTVRTTAFAVLEQIVLRITADYTAGGAIRFWQVGAVSMGTPDTGGMGWACELRAPIECQVSIQQ